MPDVPVSGAELSQDSKSTINDNNHNAIDPELLKLWMKYEDVAIHFNDLIMRWRLQVIGGLAGILTISAAVMRDNDSQARHKAIQLVASALLVMWIGVATMDIWYYRRLLSGAVDAILNLEQRVPGLRLSHDIQAAARRGARMAHWVFYGSGCLALAGIAAWATYQL